MDTLKRYISKLKISKREQLERATTPCYICLDTENKQSKLDCKHTAHKDCLKSQIEHIHTKGTLVPSKWGKCGLCGSWLQSKHIKGLQAATVKELKRFYDLWGNPGHHVFRCFICTKLFYEKRPGCADDVQEQPSPDSIRCQSCKNTCTIHGDSYLSYKCRFCCKIATWICGNGNHMCEICHETQRIVPCVGAEGGCNGNHPPNGDSSVCLGCTMCMSTLQRARISSQNLASPEFIESNQQPQLATTATIASAATSHINV